MGVFSVLFGLACYLAAFEPASDLMAAPTAHRPTSPLISSDLSDTLGDMGRVPELGKRYVEKTLSGVIAELTQALVAPKSTLEDMRSLTDMLTNAQSQIMLVSQIIELETQIIDLSDILGKMGRVPQIIDVSDTLGYFAGSDNMGRVPDLKSFEEVGMAEEMEMAAEMAEVIINNGAEDVTWSTLLFALKFIIDLWLFGNPTEATWSTLPRVFALQVTVVSLIEVLWVGFVEGDKRCSLWAVVYFARFILFTSFNSFC